MFPNRRGGEGCFLKMYLSRTFFLSKTVISEKLSLVTELDMFPTKI